MRRQDSHPHPLPAYPMLSVTARNPHKAQREDSQLAGNRFKQVRAPCPEMAEKRQNVLIVHLHTTCRHCSHTPCRHCQKVLLTLHNLHTCTLHPTPYTLHPTPYTLYPTTYTLIPRRARIITLMPPGEPSTCVDQQERFLKQQSLAGSVVAILVQNAPV